MIFIDGNNKPLVEKKLRGFKGKPIVCDQTGLYMPSMAAMGIAMKIAYPTMAKHITGKCPHAKGYTFHYASEEEIKQAEGK